MHRVKLNFSKLSIPEKIQKGYSIVGKIEGNPHFKTPNPGIDEVRAAIKALEDAHQDALDGGKSKKIIMRDREEDLDNLMVSFGAYVQNASNGDKETILSSGFEVRNAPSASQPAEAPESLSAKPGNREGEILLSWDGVEGARSYTSQISNDNGVTWTACGISTKSKLTISDLASGSKPWFRVAAIGPLGQSHWSDAAQGKTA